MPVEATHILSAGSSTDASSYETASVSIPKDRLILLTVANIRTPATANTPTVTGAGMTWTQVRTQADTENIRRVTVFRGVSSSNTSGALTIDFAGQTQLRCGWSLSSFKNTDISGTNASNAIVQSAGVGTDGSANTNIIVTLGAFSSVDNATFGGIRLGTSTGVNAGSGFTELGQADMEGGTNPIQTEFRNDNDTTVAWTWTSEVTRATGIGLEIKYTKQIDVVKSQNPMFFGGARGFTG